MYRWKAEHDKQIIFPLHLVCPLCPCGVLWVVCGLSNWPCVRCVRYIVHWHGGYVWLVLFPPPPFGSHPVCCVCSVVCCRCTSRPPRWPSPWAWAPPCPWASSTCPRCTWCCCTRSRTCPSARAASRRWWPPPPCPTSSTPKPACGPTARPAPSSATTWRHKVIPSE